MLDNLKLGYGGTREEMQRLLDDAEKLSGIKYDISSYADIVDAIHVVQTEMGITGTTALEASKTIEGSVNAMKGAWANLVTGIADENANLDELINNFVTSTETAFGNILPRIEQIFSGIGEVFAKIGPILAQKIPEMITSALPGLISAGAQILVALTNGIVQSLPTLAATVPQMIQSIVTAFQTMGPTLLQAGATLLTLLGNGIIQALPQLATTVQTLLTSFGTYLQENLPMIVEQALTFVSNFTQAIMENAPLIVDGAMALMTGLAQGIADSLPTIIEKGPEIVNNLANAINNSMPTIIAAAAQIILTLAMGLIKAIPTLIANIPQIIMAIVNTILAYNWISLGSSVIKGVANGLKSAASFVKSAVTQIANTIKSEISKLPAQMLSIGKNIVTGLWNGIGGMAGWVKRKIQSFATGIVGGLKSKLGIHSPSKVFAEIGGYMAEGLGVGWDDEYNSIQKKINSGMDFGKTSLSVESSMAGKMRNAFNEMSANLSQNATIVVQSVLDGKVIGETAYQYSRNKNRAYGVV